MGGGGIERVVRMVARERAGWVVLKRLLPWVVLVPPALGWLRWYAEASGLFSLEAGVVVMTVSLMVALAIVVVVFARWFDLADRQRQQSAEQLDQFFSLSKDLFVIADADARFLRLNPAWEHVLGFTREELLARPYLDFVHPDDVESTRTEQAKVLTGEARAAFENRWRCADGSYRWLSWEATRAPQGLIYAAARDITERKEAEEVTARLAAIVESSDDAINSTTLDGTVLSWNRGAEQIYGYQAREIMGRSVSIVAPPGRSEEIRQLLARVSEGESLRAVETMRRHKDGHLFPVALSMSPIRDSHGKTIAVSAISRDITERKHREEQVRAQREHLASVIASASDPFVEMNEQGVITEWNHRARAVFGWSEEEAIGRTVAETLVPARLRAAHWRGLQRVLDGGESRVLNELVEMPALHRDGREIPVELQMWRVEVDGSYRFNAFLRDITERKQTEQALAQARDAALDASQMKSQFLASMSHEIRTPLNGVIGLTGMLLDTNLDEVQRRYTQGIESAGRALLSVINNILDFSKIEAGKLVLDEVDFDLIRVVDDVTEMMAEPAEAKGLELIGYCRPDIPTTVRGDPDRLRQVLLNLVSNAVKFTQEGEVVVRAGASNADRDDATVDITFEVIDTGMGIAEQDRERLFQPFQQVDASTTRRFGGTGLGLAICQELTEAMGGRIGVDSQEGQGSTFWFTLPLRARPEVSVPAPASRVLDGLRVLVVDDNETNREMLIHQLLSWSMNPSADNGEHALEVLQRAHDRGQPYDLAILDMHMPGMDGVQLARRITEQPSLAGTQLVVLTSGAFVDMKTAREAGILATLTKPVHRSQLYDCLVRALSPESTPALAQEPATKRDDAAAGPREAAPGRAHVLLVEDNEINQAVALGVLAKLGYSSDLAVNGQQALDKAGANHYDAILMDCQMPVMDGYDAATELRRREALASEEARGRRVPIIALTASALQEDRQRCLEAGMDDHIAKPITLAELDSALSMWISSSGGPSDSGQPDGVPAQGHFTSTRETIQHRFDQLRDELDGDHDLVARVAASFQSRAPSLMSDLAETVRGADPQAVQRAAHSLKGAASNIGATSLAELCERVENDARTGDLESAPELLSHIETELDQVCHDINAVLGNP